MLKHYVLKSEDTLPTHAHFLDPFDKEAYTPLPQENFSQFISRIKESRVKKQAPLISDTHLKHFVQIALSQTIQPESLNHYFKTEDVPPTLTQVIGFAQTFWRALKDDSNIPIRQRQERAKDCLSCSLHIPIKNDGIFSAVAEAATNYATDATKHETYEQEHKLGKCGMCGCNLKDKVKYTAYAALVGITPEDFEKVLGLYGQHAFLKCWILREGLQGSDTNNTIQKKLNLTKQGTYLLGVYHKQEEERAKQI